MTKKQFVSPSKDKLVTVVKESCFFFLDLQRIMAESRDYDELLSAWKGWRDSAGKVLRQDYKKYVELANKAATLNGVSSAGLIFHTHLCGSLLSHSNDWFILDHVRRSR